MKSFLVFISFIAPIFLGYQDNKNNEVVINCNIVGEMPETLYHTVPVNDVCDWNFSEAAIPDSVGFFQIKYDIEKPSFLKFFIENNPVLIIEPGKKYNIVIEFNDNGNKFLIKDLSTAQNFYNELPNESPRRCIYSFNEDISNYRKIEKYLIDDLQKELAELDSLYNEKVITKEIFNLLKSERRIYYNTALSVLASRSNLQFISNNQETPREVFNIWKKASLAINLPYSYAKRTTNIIDFLYSYIWYNVYQDFEVDEITKIRKEKREQGQIHTHSLSLAEKYLPDEYLEYYFADYITLQLRQKKNQNQHEFEEIKNKYDKDFPDSKYKVFFEDL